MGGTMKLTTKTPHQIEDMRMALATFPDAFVVALLDEKTCEYCRSVNGYRIRDLVHSGDHYFPPFHDDSDPDNPYPCRCIVGLKAGEDEPSREAFLKASSHTPPSK